VRLERIIDGDTIDVGRDENIRMLGRPQTAIIGVAT